MKGNKQYTKMLFKKMLHTVAIAKTSKDIAKLISNLRDKFIMKIEIVVQNNT